MDRAALFSTNQKVFPRRKSRKCIFLTELGTRLALFRERDSSGQSMHLYQPVFLKAFD